MSTTVSYKGNTIATLDNETKTLTTSGKYMEADVVVTDTASGGTAAISVVDTIDSHGGTIREITALNISDTTAIASDVASGKYFYTANGVKTVGTSTGGTPSATAHTIYFEFTDETNTTITAYYDSSFISNAITATIPTTYGAKTVESASLDNVTWYTRPTETWEVVYNDTVDYEPDNDGTYPYCWITDLGNVTMTEGSVWRVTFDNVEYRCTAAQDTLSGTTYTYIGNPKWAGATDDGSNVPFLFYPTAWGAWSGEINSENVRSTHSVKLERLVIS